MGTVAASPLHFGYDNLYIMKNPRKLEKCSLNCHLARGTKLDQFYVYIGLLHPNCGNQVAKSIHAAVN